MKEFVISDIKAETAILVGLITQEQDEAKTKEYLDELEFLADTAGAVTVKRFTQKVGGPNQTTYVGKGKLEEIKQFIKSEEDAEREIGMVIFDDELSAKQIRNIEGELQVKILDRTSLILDIFAMRAQTANAKTQVELAQYRYMLPRLQRLWTHLERQGGGSGSGGGKGSVGLRGPGETQLEMDRRIILQRMSLLKQRLAEIDKQKVTQRKNRGRMIRVALVGYTNVGKSTLMNLLSKSEVFAENKLFATLDTTVRKVVIDNLPFLYCTLEKDDIINEIIKKGQGSAQPNISPNDIMNTLCYIPNDKVIKNFNKVCKPLFEIITKNRFENEQLTQLRDTLLPKLMNGEIDVSKLNFKDIK